MSNRAGSAASDVALVDQIVTITMDGPSLVLRPSSALDIERTHVFVEALNAAVSTGTVITITRAHRGFGELADVPVASIECGDPFSGVAAPEVDVVDAGLISVRSCGAVWTLDIVAARFCRGDDGLAVRFVGASDWLPYEAAWITPTRITVLGEDGSYLSGVRSN